MYLGIDLARVMHTVGSAVPRSLTVQRTTDSDLGCRPHASLPFQERLGHLAMDSRIYAGDSARDRVTPRMTSLEAERRPPSGLDDVAAGHRLVN